MNSLQYVIGYGSLISSEARLRTGEAQGAHAMRLNGYQRYWQGYPPQPRAVLGVRPETGVSCNGILFQVSDTSLESFDARERGYLRVLVPWKRIELLSNGISTDCDGAWLYVPSDIQLPCEQHPIVQSYVDVAVSGCLEFNRDFAREFVETTEGLGCALDR